MKLFIPLLSYILFVQSAAAQCYLMGTSYQQNFNSLSSGLPAGWEVDTGATAIFKGYPKPFDTSRASWSNTTGKFKNFASRDTLPATAPSTIQTNFPNRALGLRSTAAFGDSNAAFVFQVANTTGLTNLQLSFKLMSLDSNATRVATWRVDYATGNNPTSFTPIAATGTLTTGGNSFSANTITASFGNTLDYQPGPVWIRIVTVSKTTGANSRPSTAIDDFNLTWTGIASGPLRPMVMSVSPGNGASLVGLNPNLEINFNRNIQKGNSGNIYITDEHNNTTQTIPATSSDVATNGTTATITGFSLNAGTTYNIRFDSTAFDTSSFHSFGLYDTSGPNAWRFTTLPQVLTVSALNENFTNACATNALPDGWTLYDANGSEHWSCYSMAGNAVYRMYGFTNGMHQNEDWLITPRIDLSNAADASLFFRSYKKHTGQALQLLISHNYIGYGAPGSAIWTDLQIPFKASDTDTWKNHTTNISNFIGQPFFLAFKYNSSATDGYDQRIDSIWIEGTEGIPNLKQEPFAITVIGTPSNNQVNLLLHLPAAGEYQIVIIDVLGKKLFQNSFRKDAATEMLTIAPLQLSSGVYFIKLGNRNGCVATKIVIP